jgi:hypothetical protein
MKELDQQTPANEIVAPRTPQVTPPTTPPVVVPPAAPAAPSVVKSQQAPKVSGVEMEKAREALRKKMSELDQQAPVTESAPITVAPSTTPSAISSPVAPGVVFQEVPEVPEVELEKAREALRKRMEALEQKPVVATRPIEPKNSYNSAEVESKQRATPSASTAEMNSTPPAAKETGARESVRASKPAPRSKTAPVWPAMQGPASGLSAAKEQQLQVLLEDYRADRLTPEQYHAERAKILAAP